MDSGNWNFSRNLRMVEKKKDEAWLKPECELLLKERHDYDYDYHHYNTFSGHVAREMISDSDNGQKCLAMNNYFTSFKSKPLIKIS